MAHKVVAKVVKAKGHCTANHKVDDVFEFGVTAPAGICCHAFGAIWPSVNLILNGGSYSWDSEPGKTYWGCPDTQNLVMFELQRVELPD